MASLIWNDECRYRYLSAWKELGATPHCSGANVEAPKVPRYPTGGRLVPSPTSGPSSGDRYVP